MINVTLLANAGLLIDTGRFRLLADGLYSDTGHTFSTIPEETEQRLMAGGGEFGQIHYLLFTHLHPDHFDRHKVDSFIENHDVLGVFFPLADSAAMDIEMKIFMSVQRDNPYTQPLALNRGASRRIVIDGDTELTAFCTGHMGAQYSDVQNICYLLKAGGKTLLITGDADYDAADFAAADIYGPPDAIAVNPLFLQAKRGAELLRILSPRQLILYHIPFESDDTMRLRVMVRHQLQRFANENYTIVPLFDSMQSVNIL